MHLQGVLLAHGDLVPVDEALLGEDARDLDLHASDTGITTVR
jgi:hypothetical protein